MSQKRTLRGKSHCQNSQRDDSQRKIDVEDPAPGQVRRKVSTEQWTGDRSNSKSSAKDPLVSSAISRRNDVAHDCLRRDHQSATTETLNRTKQDQVSHGLTQTAQRRTDQENDDCKLKYALSTVEIAELAVDWSDDGLGQKIRGDDPRKMFQSAELADDSRKRCRNDRRVERSEQHDEQQAAEDNQDLLV